VPSMKRLLIASLLVAPALAHAHTGAGPAHGFLHGVEHPIFGLDHLLAMLAVGLWAVQLGGRAIWAVPASFVGVMALGGLLGMSGFQFPMVETGILVSVLLLGLLVAFAVRIPVWASALLVGVFALFHGFAHGAEMPAEASGLAYAAGFALATALLHGVGIGFGLAVRNLRFAPVLRIAGGAVMVAGVVLALS
jgi:urease accessory protein